MRPLSQHQIKEQELKLLQISGFSLGEYADSANQTKLFKELPSTTQIKQLDRLRITRIRSAGLSANANLKAFCCALLQSIYWSETREQVLHLVKSALYNPTVDLPSIKHHSLPHLNNNQMKKLVVEFFYSLAYSDYDHKVEDKLCKFPIVMEILVLFVRRVLANLGLKNSDDCLFSVPTHDSYELLIDFFDLNCRSQNSLFLFYEDRIFILENQHYEMLIGCYNENQAQKLPFNMVKNGLKLSQLQQQIDQDTQNDQERRKSLASQGHNRSLQIRGIVSESIVFEPQAPTPFFNLQGDNNSSFSNSIQLNNQQQDGPGSRRQSFMKASKDMSLLKMMDRTPQPQNGVFGQNLKKTMMENQLKQSLQSNYKEGIGMALMDSPITLDSPHSLFTDGNFASLSQLNNHLHTKQQIKVMKKSKSQNGARMSKQVNQVSELEDQEEQKFNSHSKNYSKRDAQHDDKHCKCTTNKQRKIKLFSNLYEINMTYVKVNRAPSFLRKSKIEEAAASTPNLDINSGQYYISSKGINCEIYAPKAMVVNEQKYNIKSVPIFQPKHMREGLIKSYQTIAKTVTSAEIIKKVNPESDNSISKRQFSPLSNNDRERQFSPYGGTKSINSPKITFSYQNKLKYSVQLPNDKNTIKGK